VPLLGAGISAESGYPITTAIIDYLARAQLYLDQRVYDPRPREARVAASQTNKQSRKAYLRRFGWPKPSLLTQELWNHFSDPSSTASTNGSSPLHSRKRLRVAVDHILQDELRVAYPAIAKLYENFAPEQRPSPPSLVRWRDYVRSVTDADPSLIDSMFQSFNVGRVPGMSHRYLTFLARLLSWKLFLTTNFDDLLERALRAEGLAPTVYDISQGVSLPDAALVRRQLSIIKLHGTAFGLRVGETLDDPMPLWERDQLLRYLPEDALILVLGYGGQDRRILDLLEGWIERPNAPDPAVIWIHFERSLPSRIVERLSNQAVKRIRAYRTFDPAAFLVEFFEHLTSVHPISTQPYTHLRHRHLGLALQGDTHRRSLVVIDTLHPESQQAASSIETPIVCDPDKPVCCFIGTTTDEDVCSIAMSQALGSLPGGYTPLWVDVGSLQTVEEVVVDIIRQCRRYDPELPTFVLDVDRYIDIPQPQDGCVRKLETARQEEQRKKALRLDEELHKAVRLVHNALSRGRYALAIDGFDTFGRPATSHHGVPQSFLNTHRFRHFSPIPRVDALVNFLCKLIDWFVEDTPRNANRLSHDSRILLAITPLQIRRFDGTPKQELSPPNQEISDGCLIPLYKSIAHGRESVIQTINFSGRAEPPRFKNAESLVIALKTSCGEKLSKYWDAISLEEHCPQNERDEIAQTVQNNALAMLELIATFRRPRSLVALRSLLAPYLPSKLTAEEHPSRHTHELIDCVLDALRDLAVIRKLEGGYYWMTSSARNTVYSALSRSVNSLEFLTTTNADQELHEFYGHQKQSHSQPAASWNDLEFMIRGCAKLTLHHDEVARYYDEALFLASRDVGVLLEYLYHRVSSLRHGTMLGVLLTRSLVTPDAREALLAAFPNDSLADTDRVGRFISRSIRDNSGHADPSAPHRIRLFKLRELDRVLKRERESLLSEVPSYTLLMWIDCIGQLDLGRIRLTHFDEWHTGLAHQGRLDASSRHTIDNIESEIESLCFGIRESFLEIKCKVLRDRTDYDSCFGHLILQILPIIAGWRSLIDHWDQLVESNYLFKLLDYRADDPDDWKQRQLFQKHLSWFENEIAGSRRFRDRARASMTQLLGAPLESLFESVRARGAAQNRDISKDTKVILVALVDMAYCLHGMGDTKNAITLLRSVLKHSEAMREGDTKSRDEYESALHKARFRLAELELAHLHVWEMKNGGYEARDRLKIICERVERYCDEGLDLLRDTKTDLDKDPLYRCYFRSHKARSKALRSHCLTAFQEFDLAALGLNPRDGKSRVAMAAQALYTAEALMFRSDQIIINKCMEWLDAHNAPDASPQRLDFDRGPMLAVLSPLGAYFLCSELFSATAGNGDSIPSHTSIRRLISPLFRRRIGHVATRLQMNDLIDTRREHFDRLDAVRQLYDSNADPFDFNAAFVYSAKLCNELRHPHNRSDPDSTLVTQALVQRWNKRNDPQAPEAIQPTREYERRKDIRLALRRSLSYWNEELLASTVQSRSPEMYDLLQHAQTELERMRGALDRAETLLSNARRDTKFWYMLYTLRANHAFECLLLKLAQPLAMFVGAQGTTETGSQLAPPSEHSLSVLADELAECGRAGLRATGSALDCRLSQHDLASDNTRILQMWNQLLIVFACFPAIRHFAAFPQMRLTPQDQTRVVEDAWNRWVDMNRAVGLLSTSLIAGPKHTRDVWLLDFSEDSTHTFNEIAHNYFQYVFESTLEWLADSRGADHFVSSTAFPLLARAFLESHLKLSFNRHAMQILDGADTESAAGQA
jgi:hypothetical protein